MFGGVRRGWDTCDSREDFARQLEGLIAAHPRGALGGQTMPEHGLVGAAISTRTRLDVLTLPMALNYQRSSYALWEAVRNALDDPEARWVFVPEVAAEADPAALREVLVRCRIALQPNRHPDIWRRVAGGIAASSDQRDVLGLVRSTEIDVAGMIALIRERRRREFPYLSGPKIFNYWLYVLEAHGGIKWRRRDLISIAPDTHILQASVRLGIVNEAVLDGSERSREETASAWKDALDGTGLAPIDVHTPLWLWSRMGFPALGELHS